MDYTVQRFFINISFLMCIITLIGGVLLCVIKSPNAMADTHLSMAVKSYDMGNLQESKQWVLLSLQSNPSSLKAWHMMANILRDSGDVLGQKQALKIVAAFESNSNQSPTYAIPADLKLSLLSLQNQDIR